MIAEAAMRRTSPPRCAQLRQSRTGRPALRPRKCEQCSGASRSAPTSAAPHARPDRMIRSSRWGEDPQCEGKQYVALAAPAPFAGLPRSTSPDVPSPHVTERPHPAAAAPAGDALPPPPPRSASWRARHLAGKRPHGYSGSQTQCTAAAKPRPYSGWIIQVGAIRTRTRQAEARHGEDQGMKLLSDADPFTEPTVKDGTTYYRARFAGLTRISGSCLQLSETPTTVECVAYQKLTSIGTGKRLTGRPEAVESSNQLCWSF